METPILFGIAAVKQETEDESSDGDKDVFGSKHHISSIEHESSHFSVSAGISSDCIANSNHLQQEFNTDDDKDAPIIGPYENDVSKQGCGTPYMPDLISVCLKQEMIVDCQENELPSNIYVFAENDMVKQEVCHTGETPFENIAYKKALLQRSHITPTKEKPFKCHICEKLFTSSFGLSHHERTHSGEKPFKCDMCEKRFSSTSYLSKHQRSHTGEKPFKCDICEKNFRQKFTLSNHQRTHTGEKPFKCHTCEKSFSSISGLSHHQRTHSGEKPFECHVCEKRFSRPSYLSEHQRSHTGEKPFECDICDKNFRHKNALSNHQRTHTGEKPFKCHICEKGFTSNSNLSYHQRTHSGCMRKNIPPKKAYK